MEFIRFGNDQQTVFNFQDFRIQVTSFAQHYLLDVIPTKDKDKCLDPNRYLKLNIFDKDTIFLPPNLGGYRRCITKEFLSQNPGATITASETSVDELYEGVLLQWEKIYFSSNELIQTNEVHHSDRTASLEVARFYDENNPDSFIFSRAEGYKEVGFSIYINHSVIRPEFDLNYIRSERKSFRLTEQNQYEIVKIHPSIKEFYVVYH